jgi:hypothetical protein
MSPSIASFPQDDKHMHSSHEYRANADSIMTGHHRMQEFVG